MTQQRLSKRQINKLYKEYNDYFDGNETQIAYELAKDFIYNASREYQRFLNQAYASHTKTKFSHTICEKGFNLRKQAIEETSEYLNPQNSIKESFEQRIAKQQFKKD